MTSPLLKTLLITSALWLCPALAALQEAKPAETSAAPAVAAQATPAGEVSGTVKAGNVPLPGVVISAANTLTGKKVFTSTSMDGTFVLSIPRNGRYVVRAELSAFAPATKEVVINAAAAAHKVEFEMQLLSRVQADPEQQQDQTQQQLNAIAGRGFQNLGVSQGQGEAAPSSNDTSAPALPAGGLNADAATDSVSISGNLGRTESFGFDNADMMDRVQEMRARGGDMGGMMGGGIMGGPMVMLGGGGRGGRGRFNVNQPHGALFYNYGGSALEARPYSLTGIPAAKADYARSTFGATVGGPLNIPRIYKGGTRTFYFVNYFGSLGSNPFDVFATVPTLAERAGDFSNTRIRSGPNAGQLVQIVDPLTGLPFPGNQVPLSRMNPAALGLLRFFPEPDSSARSQNFHRVSSTDSSNHNINMRLIHNFGGGPQSGGPMAMFGGGGNNLNLSFNHRTSGADINNASPELGGSIASQGLNFNIGYVRRFGKLTNRLSFGFNQNQNQNANFFAGVEDVAGDLGINGVSSDPFDFGPSALAFTNYSGIRDVTPQRRSDSSISISDSMSWNRKKHNLRWGGDYRRSFLNLRSNNNPRGSFTFTGASTALRSGGAPVAGTGYDFADFLLGFAQQTSLQFGPNSYQFRGNSFNLFVQDDYRIHPKLTLNLGLRYEYVSPYTEVDGRLVNLDANADFSAVASVQPGQTGPFSGSFSRSLVQPDRNNLAPRVGVAWTPLKQTVLRAGYGIHYNVGAYSNFVQQLAYQPPFSSTQTNIATTSTEFSFQNGFPAPASALTNSFGVDRDYRMGYVQSWNLDIQRQLRPTIMLNLGYNGAKGTRLDTQRAPNRGPLGLRIPGVQPFIWQSSESSSTLHSASLRLRKRMQKGISVGGTYTFAKSIDNASNIGGSGSVVAQNDLDLAAERGLSSFDVRHRLTGDYNLELPFGTNKRWLANSDWRQKVFGDWSFNGSFILSSGSPFTPRVLGDFLDVARGSNGTLRANATGQPVESDDPTVARFFNTAAFTTPPAGTFGNAGRNSIIGPGTVLFDLSLGKTVQLKDMRAFEFRASATNLFNHAKYQNIDTTVNSPSYGRVTSVAPMRKVQLQTRFRF